jgi:hypothetical protein
MTTTKSQTDYNAMTNEAYRAMVRSWFEENCPPECRHPSHRLRRNEIEHWTKKIAEKGWIAPGWPKEFGGMGLDVEKLLIHQEQIEDLGVARAPDQGIVMLGPLLIHYGNEEQRARFLPGITKGEEVWCQGYSEPEAGSDLASLRCEAIRDGDHYVVNGQKTWSTLAQDADWIFTLVRTEKGRRKQEGISFLLIDIKSPGVTVRPIRNLGDEEEFSEVIFENVRVPVENRVGEEGKGWQIAKALLGFERIFIGSPRLAQYALGRLKAIGESLKLADEPVFAEKYARLKLDVDDHARTYLRYADVLVKGGTLGPETSVLKIFGTENYQRITEMIVEVLSEYGPVTGEVKLADGLTLHHMYIYYYSRATTIYAGSNEIQRNILAKAVLKLPSA